MKIAVLKESGAETRVAAIPETVKKYLALGASVAVEQGAGASAAATAASSSRAAASMRSRRASIVRG